MFGPGGLMGDMQRAMDRNFADNQSLEIQRLAAVIREIDERVLEGQEYAAGVVGVREATFVQLARFDPNNPILKDTSLIERIKKAAYAAFKIDGLNYGAAREVGRTFRIPGAEGPVRSSAPAAPAVVSPFARAAIPAAPAAALPPTLEAVHKHPAHVELQQQYAGSLALRAALSEVVKQLDPNHPLIKDHFLQSNIRRAGLTAFTLANMDYNAARSAGVSFVLPKPAAKDADQPGS